MKIIKFVLALVLLSASGPFALLSGAEVTAKFAPTMVDGVPVNASGGLMYSFAIR
jgi:hypothetical protein